MIDSKPRALLTTTLGSRNALLALAGGGANPLANPGRPSKATNSWHALGFSPGLLTKITMIGTMPPIKGVSDYCIEQVGCLSQIVPVKFFNFNSIYPEFLYPGGGTKEKNAVFARPAGKNIEIIDSLAWWNPFSWLHAGLSAEGEILHFHWWTFWLFPVFFTIVLTAKLRKKKIVCTIHNVTGHESGFVDKFLSKAIFFLPDKFIVHTQENKRQLKDYFHVKDSRIDIVPHGIYEFYNAGEEISKNDARKKLEIPLKAKVLLFFGNIRKYKGLEDLIESFKIAKNQIPELYLVIAGKPWEKEFTPYLENALAGIPEKKLSLGYIASSEIKNYFSAADIVVLPYRDFAAQSGPGNIALAFEKPLIVSNVGGLPDLVLNKEMVFPAGNTVELSSRIVRVFSEKNLLDSLSRDSAKLRQEYSWKNICKRTLNIYNALLGK